MAGAIPETEFDRRLGAKPPVHLAVEGLRVVYQSRRGPVAAVDGVSFEVRPGMVLGLVGESGCGKSTVVKALMRLLPDSARVGGRVLLDGRDILAMDARALRRVRWNQIALITQSAMNALDPVIRVGDQIVESIRAHEEVGRATAWARAETLFALVGLPPGRLEDYPHQFSGGMRQRAVIAMALSLNAGLLLADEPTTALDPIMQDQIMARIRRIKEVLHRSMILVTHDVGLVAENCDSVAVMYAGRIVESGPASEVLVRPSHPYTIGLHNAFPRMPAEGERRPPLISIAGALPDLLAPPAGCRFAPRCPFATDRCRAEDPALRPAAPGQAAACHHAAQAGEFRRLGALPETWKAMAEAVR
ncbi:MAG: ABC transporter ATP-binding protein [Rhodobacteraceae bacterium]|jgi:oligopeptide/dipeptide ABC transporter ATP-binding protein|nr:ABC transporter ATP-binding protein [Paracoccaceae bacterium]